MVTNTDDSGPGSLRQAILDANSNPGKDFIHFDVPDIWMATIRPLSELPAISEEVEINGFSQPGSRMNSNPAGTGFNTSLQIVLDGVNAGPGAEGLIIAADGCTVSGIVITRFTYSGIALTADNNLVRECFIGTDSTGYQYQDNGNDTYGIRIYGANNNEIRSCVISGNGAPGTSPNIAIGGGSSQNNIFGNLIGTDISGTIPTPNTARAIGILESPDNTIGGSTDEERNVLFGGLDLNGASTTGNEILGNYMVRMLAARMRSVQAEVL